MKKENLQQAVKLYFRTYLGAVMGVFIYLSVGGLATVAFPGGEFDAAGWNVINSIALFLQGGLFYLIVYSKLWELGEKDGNNKKFEQQGGSKWRGLHIGLMAAVPSMLSFVLLVADKLFSFWDKMALAYRGCQLALYPLVAWGLGPNVQATTADASWGGILLAGLPAVFVPVVTTIAYTLGYRHLVFWQNVVFKKKK